MQGLPAPAVTCLSRGLLPHVFTITLRGSGEEISPKVTDKSAFAKASADESCNFLWHYLFLSPNMLEEKTRLFTGTLPYAVQTFLTPDKSGAR